MRCYHCMAEIQSNHRRCPYCGGALEQPNLSYHLKAGAQLNGRYLVGNYDDENSFGIRSAGLDLTRNARVVITEYFPSGVAARSPSGYGALPVATALQPLYLSGRDSFLQEAQLLSQFASEPCIEQVSDFFAANQTAYCITEYTEGKTLARLVKEGTRFEPQRLITALFPLMQALHRLHAAGVFHCDISPDTIIMQGDGTLKLTRFGGAGYYFADGQRGAPQAQLAAGYAPLEQYVRQENRGPWMDVYALCAVIYTCVTGVAPPDSCERVTADTLQLPSQSGVDIAPPMEEVLLRGLAVQPANRILNMEVLRSAFDHAVASSKGVVFDRPPAAVQKKKTIDNPPTWIREEITGGAVATGKTVQQEEAQPDLIQPEPVQPGPLPYTPIQPERVQYTPVQPNPVQPRTPQPEPVRHERTVPANRKSGKKRWSILTAVITASAVLITAGVMAGIFLLKGENPPVKATEAVVSAADESSAAAPETKEPATDAPAAEETTTSAVSPKNADLTDLIDAATRESRTFSVQKENFAYIDKNGVAHSYRIESSELKEIPYEDPDNSGLTAVEFSRYGNCVGFGVKEDGSAVLLTAGDSNFDYLKILSDLDNVEDIASFEVLSKKNDIPRLWGIVLVLHRDGTVLAFHLDEDGVTLRDDLVKEWKDIKSASFLQTVPIGLKKDGTLITLTSSMEEYQKFTDIAAISEEGMEFGDTIFLKKNGTLTVSRTNDTWSSVDMDKAAAWTGIIAFSGGSSDLLGLRTDGTVAAVGKNENGQGNVSEWADIAAIQSCGNYSVGKKTDGTFVIATNDEKLAKSFNEVVNHQ